MATNANMPGTPKERKGVKRSRPTLTRSMVLNNITTCVFLEMESTALLTEQGKKTRITEICLLAIRRNDLLFEGPYPRVTSELRLCFNPGERISSKASLLSGLTNDLLEDQPRFGETTVSIINIFLERLPGPVCLVAHYGYGFDFPLLQEEVRKTGGSLMEGLFCVDSMEIFQKMHPELSSYKLKDVYARLYNCNSHHICNANDRCVSAVKCALKTMDYARCLDKKKRLFASINPDYHM